MKTTSMNAPLVEALVAKGWDPSRVVWGRRVSGSPYGVELEYKGTVIYYDGPFQTVRAGDLLGWMESALDRTLVPVTVPRAGRITSLALYRGQYATAGTPVVEIHELDRLRAILEVDESDIGRVEVGQRVELSFTSLGLDATGAVSKVAALPTIASGGRPGQSRKYEVEVPLDGPDARIIVGPPMSISSSASARDGVPFVTVSMNG